VSPTGTPAGQLARAAESLRAAGLDLALLATPPNVTYVSGFEAPLPVGYVTEVTGWRPCLALLRASDATGWLIVPDVLEEAARGQAWFERVLPFDSLGHFEPVDPARSYAHALETALREAGVTASAWVGIDPTLPAEAHAILLRALPEAQLQDATPALYAARRIKTPREIELLRAAAVLADTAQERLLAASRTGVGCVDIDLWRDLVAAMEHRAGRLLTVQGALLTGPRTAVVAGALPDGRIVEQGDLALLDISPRLDGYWADCCNVVVFGGEPDADQLRWFSAARAAFEAGAETLRPGRRCRDVAAAVEVALARHGLPVTHYSGHQIGTGVNEPPRLVPYDETVIEPGMVFAVEPGAYAGAGGHAGARAEQMVLVTDAGPEPLSSFTWGL